VIISNLSIIIFVDNANLDMSSKSMVATPTDKPLFEMVEADSNRASIKLLSSRKPMVRADAKYTAMNRAITNNAYLKGLYGIGMGG
jgi:hypothetical protein